MEVQTTMRVERMTAIPLDRFWQECFLSALGNGASVEDAGVVADEATARYGERRAQSYHNMRKYQKQEDGGGQG